MTTETNYQLAEDDVLYVDFGCIYQYCFSDSGTTFGDARTIVGVERAP